MHPTTYHQLATMKQAELMREAADQRLVREAREANRAAGHESPLASLRGALGSLAQSLKPAKSGSLGSVRHNPI